MFDFKSIHVSVKSWHLIVFLAALVGFTAGCHPKGGTISNGSGASGSVENPTRSVSVVKTPLVASAAAPTTSREDGGDRLPIVVDPKSPGSCAIVATGDQCGECCNDVFNEESEQWSVCTNACIKADAVMHEH